MSSSNSLDQRILRLVVSPARSVHLSVVCWVILVSILTTSLIISFFFSVVKHMPHPSQSIIVEFSEPLAKEGFQEENKDQDDKSDEDDANDLCNNESCRLLWRFIISTVILFLL